MESTSILLKKIQSLEFRKKKGLKKSGKKKCCKKTLLIEVDVERKHFPCSISKCTLKTEQNTTESKMYYDFSHAYKQKDRVLVTMATTRRLLTQINFFISTKRSFFLKILSFMRTKTIQLTYFNY